MEAVSKDEVEPWKQELLTVKDYGARLARRSPILLATQDSLHMDVSF